MYNYKTNVFTITKLSIIQNWKQNAPFSISSLKRKTKKKFLLFISSYYPIYIQIISNFKLFE
jgi:hypothetical protein